MELQHEFPETNSKNTGVTLRARIQKMGAFLSAMVMPNIGAFIAWGLLTAFFIPTGWIPNEHLAELIGPTITYLLPLLIGYTGGYNVHGRRGGVIGAVATMGVVIGSDITMLIGAMIMGPLAAYCMKKIDQLLKGKIRPGLEMLVDNFSLGIFGGIIMLLGFLTIEPIFGVILTVLSSGVQWIMDRNLIPLTSIFVQPAQLLFLNNAINHGIMVPLGLEQAKEIGKSILFLIEANGGTWLGLLLAFSVFGKGIAKKSAPAASLIVFLGGIGEVAFPYALMKPITVLGPMIGNMVALFLLQMFNGGAVAAVSPGSFLALVAMSPKSAFFINIIAYVVATVVSFLVVAFFLKRDKSVVVEGEKDGALVTKTPTNLAVTTDVQSKYVENTNPVVQTNRRSRKSIENVVIACDAGMGSSAMGLSILKTKAKKAMLDLQINNVSIDHIPDNIDVIITNAVLAERVRSKVNDSNVQIFVIKNFLDNSEYDRILEMIKDYE